MTSEVLIKKLDGTIEPVPGDAVTALRGRLVGPLVLPGDQGYDSLREVWNAQIERRPGAIVRVSETQDIVEAVRFARDHGLLVSIRGGGHNAAGLAVSDGGLMIDLQSYTRVRVDPVARRAYAQSGATWADYDRETQYFGLGSPGGAVSHTGIAGLTLGGGFGWLSGHHGLACDNVESIELVTADGELRRASAEENPDLFWALRGGGGNFGVVTQFEYRLHEVGLLYGGLLVYPVARAKDFLALYADHLHACSDGFGSGLGFISFPDGTRAFGGVLSFVGSFDDGEAELKPFRSLGDPLVDTIGPIRYTDIQKANDATTAPHRRYYTKSKMFKTLEQGAIDIMADRFDEAQSPLSMVLLQSFGNAVGRVPQESTAYAHRDVKVEEVTFAAWLDPSEDELHKDWGRTTAAALDPYSHGQYVNHAGLGEDEGEIGLRAAFGSNWDRLLEVKQKYDPQNLFRHNQNIRPM